MSPSLKFKLEAVAAAMLGAGLPFLIEAFSDDRVTAGELKHAGFLALAGGLLTVLAYIRQAPQAPTE